MTITNLKKIPEGAVIHDIAYKDSVVDIVLVEWLNGEWTVHYYNKQTGGLFGGKYLLMKQLAQEKFNEMTSNTPLPLNVM